MILASSGILASQIASFDADASAFFARVTAAGGSLTLSEKTATNQLVLDLKANSLWTPMKAIYPMVGASAAACAQNLKSSSFTGTFTSGWTFSSTGATPNGTSAYMDTGVINNIDLTDLSSHWSFYLRNANPGQGWNGYYNTTSVFGLQQRSTVGKVQLGLNNLLSTIIDYKIGFFVGKTNGSTGKVYINNTFFETQSSVAISQNLSFYIGALNNNGGGAFLYSSHQISFNSLGATLTDAQASAFYTNVQTFQTTLSRQV